MEPTFTETAIVWIRNDLRLRDNPALIAAARHRAVAPVFIWSPEEDGKWPLGAAGRYWLRQSLAALHASLRGKQSGLILRRGPVLRTLEELVDLTRAGAVYWNRRYEPAARAADDRVERALRSRGVLVESFQSALLHEPGEVLSRDGRPFQVFSAFWNACKRRQEPSAPLPPPSKLGRPTPWPDSVNLDALGLDGGVPNASGIRAEWTFGEAAAINRLDAFLTLSLERYPAKRDQPAARATSRLSPHLRFGEISPRQVWHAVREHGAMTAARGVVRGEESYLRELGWREFAYYLLYHFPRTADRPLRENFARFPWSRDARGLRAWQEGRTGYPIVDAGMRELLRTGWMHNRVRMIVASFLTKDLLISWQAGARWFWDKLVDADLANNTLGWQWSSGCGADAAPYFRIFNPVAQGMKFDPEGAYVRKHVPELAKLDAKWIHRPWEASEEHLRDARVVLGETYPLPMVNHLDARQRALEAFAAIKGGTLGGSRV